jgi:N6-L-threonylcarbamoyladenine synthase
VSQYILAFESSCDDTAIALVDACGKVVADLRTSQIAIHNQFGGVVPEVASRSHESELKKLYSLLAKDKIESSQIKAVAATCGPGLIGPLLVGASFARGLARGWNKPFLGVHHLRGHVASVLLDTGSAEPIPTQAGKIFPAWVLLVSGGHTQVLAVNPDLSVRKLAETADDAAGECFDKSAKLMGLPYPGGPQIESLAQKVQSPTDLARAKALAADLPSPRSQQGFSFSGLKTAIRLRLEKNPELKTDPAFAWAIENAIAKALCATLTRLLRESSGAARPERLLLCGGVAANKTIRSGLEAIAREESLEIAFPPIRYCTDNAAMIGAAAWCQKPAFNLNDVQAQVPLEDS